MTKTALISVSDKTGIVDLAKGLIELDFRIISTGGTHKLLRDAGIGNLLEVADFTGFPEGLEGRIKTLTPQVFGGILSLRDNEEHQKFCTENHIESIDLVVVNLYPFKGAYYDEQATFEDKVEKIDIGGPSMIRAAAKNYAFCAPVVDPSDYEMLLRQYKEQGDLALDFRKKLAAKVFAMTAHYDLLIAKFWEEEAGNYPLRYGENPHQKGVVLEDPFARGASLVTAEILNGKPMSFNNFGDGTGALELALAFEEPFAAIIKHATPCGAAVGGTIEDAFARAYETDPLSSFGGVIAVNRPVTRGLAEQIVSFFNEIVIAPDVDDDALEILKTKPNLRVLKLRDFTRTTDELNLKKIRGGTLLQDLDTYRVRAEDLQCVTKRKPTDAQIRDLLFAWENVKIVKSNAITLAKDGVLIGKGGGQTSRIDAAEIALRHAGEKAQGAVMGSDAFFPFPDVVELAAKYSVEAIIHPGGSRNDEAVVAKADELNIAIVYTGVRAFLHS